MLNHAEIQLPAESSKFKAYSLLERKIRTCPRGMKTSQSCRETRSLMLLEDVKEKQKCNNCFRVKSSVTQSPFPAPKMVSVSRPTREILNSLSQSKSHFRFSLAPPYLPGSSFPGSSLPYTDRC